MSPEKQNYVCPKAEELRYETEGIVCESGYLDDYTVIDPWAV